jgi:hypothetical protein
LYLIRAACTAYAIANPAMGGQGCSIYPPNYTYVRSNARCFCECAGDSAWSQYVRACLQCHYSNGTSGTDAHTICYAEATAIIGSPPYTTLGVCYTACAGVIEDLIDGIRFITPRPIYWF